MQFDIPIPALHLWRCCDHESARYALGGVQFTCDPQGVCKATATDGRHLGQVQWQTRDDEFVAGATIIPRATVAAALKMPRERCSQRAIFLEGNTLRIDFASPSLEFVPERGRFPRADDVLDARPSFKGDPLRRLNPRYLRNLLRVAAAVTQASERESCEVVFSGDDTSMVFVNAAHDGIVFHGAIMPLFE